MRQTLLSRVARPIKKIAEPHTIELSAKRLPRSDRTRALTAEIAPNGDVLWIDGPVELTAVSSTAIIRECAD
jgi:hypothetical protein